MKKHNKACPYKKWNRQADNLWKWSGMGVDLNDIHLQKAETTTKCISECIKRVDKFRTNITLTANHQKRSLHASIHKNLLWQKLHPPTSHTLHPVCNTTDPLPVHLIVTITQEICKYERLTTISIIKTIVRKKRLIHLFKLADSLNSYQNMWRIAPFFQANVVGGNVSPLTQLEHPPTQHGMLSRL